MIDAENLESQGDWGGDDDGLRSPAAPHQFLMANLGGQIILSESLLNEGREGSNSSSPSFGSYLENLEPEDPFTLLDDEVHFEAVYDPDLISDYSSPRQSFSSSSRDPSHQTTGSPDLSVPLPLENTWVFWYDERTSRGLTEHDYESSIISLGSFNTAQDFWRYWNTLIALRNLPDYFNLRIFKQGIRPLWEDPANKSGGKWAFSLPKSYRERVWTEVAMALVGEQIELSEDLCGVVFSARPKADIVHIWNSQIYDDQTIDDITRQIRKIIGFDRNILIEYTPHKGALQQNQKLLRRATNSQRSSAKSSASNSRNNSRRSSIAPRGTPDPHARATPRSMKGSCDDLESLDPSSMSPSGPTPRGRTRGIKHSAASDIPKRHLFTEEAEPKSPSPSLPPTSLLVPVKILQRPAEAAVAPLPVEEKRNSVVFADSTEPQEAHAPSSSFQTTPSAVEASTNSHSPASEPPSKPSAVPLLVLVPTPPTPLAATSSEKSPSPPPAILVTVEKREQQKPAKEKPLIPELVPVSVPCPPLPTPSSELRQLAKDLASLEHSIADVEATLRLEEEEEAKSTPASQEASLSLESILKDALQEISKVEEKIAIVPKHDSRKKARKATTTPPPPVANKSEPTAKVEQSKKAKAAEPTSTKKPALQAKLVPTPKLTKADTSASKQKDRLSSKRASFSLDLDSPAVLMTQYVAGALVVVLLVVYLS